jgi:hypothetical protein
MAQQRQRCPSIHLQHEFDLIDVYYGKYRLYLDRHHHESDAL